MLSRRIAFLSVLLMAGSANADWWSDRRDAVTGAGEKVVDVIKDPKKVGEEVERWRKSEPVKKVVGVVKDPKNKGTAEVGRWVEDATDVLHLGGQVCRAVANDLIETQGAYKSTKLTELEKKYLTPWFRDTFNGKKIDLDRVTIFWNVDLLNGEFKDPINGGKFDLWESAGAQTFGYRIFIGHDGRSLESPGQHIRHDPGDVRQLIEIAHELVHTQQHEAHGGLTPFCQTYANGFINGGFDYLNNEMEKRAFSREWEFAKSLEKYVNNKSTEVENPYTMEVIKVPLRLPDEYTSHKPDVTDQDSTTNTVCVYNNSGMNVNVGIDWIGNCGSDQAEISRDSARTFSCLEKITNLPNLKLQWDGYNEMKFGFRSVEHEKGKCIDDNSLSINKTDFGYEWNVSNGKR